MWYETCHFFNHFPLRLPSSCFRHLPSDVLRRFLKEVKGQTSEQVDSGERAEIRGGRLFGPSPSRGRRSPRPGRLRARGAGDQKEAKDEPHRGRVARTQARAPTGKELVTTLLRQGVLPGYWNRDDETFEM